MSVEQGYADAPLVNNHRARKIGALRFRIGAAAGLALIAIGAGAAISAYVFLFRPLDTHVRGQVPETHEGPHFVHQGSKIMVPQGSALRGKLIIDIVAAKDIQRRLSLPAVVEADPARTVKVLPPVAGRVVDLKAQLGERIVQGQELAVIDSSDLAQAYADDEKARASLKLTKQALDRLMILEKSSAIAVKEREQAQSDNAQAQAEFARAQSRLRAIGVSAEPSQEGRLLSLTAPAAGSIIDLQVSRGAYLNDPTAAIMTIANLATVWVTANVPEKDTALVTTGQSVEVVFTAYPNEVFKGQVLFVSDVLDPDTRRTKVRIAFANPDMRLKPNMFANAEFVAPARTMPVVPTTALILRNETDQVFVEVEPWTFEARQVEVAFQQGDEAVIAHGVAAGERVVVKGGVLLND
jgi:cobalt-zinc-cadmium efflux system membrane fusion protein